MIIIFDIISVVFLEVSVQVLFWILSVRIASRVNMYLICLSTCRTLLEIFLSPTPQGRGLQYVARLLMHSRCKLSSVRRLERPFPEDRTLHYPRCENLKSYLSCLFWGKCPSGVSKALECVSAVISTLLSGLTAGIRIYVRELFCYWRNSAQGRNTFTAFVTWFWMVVLIYLWSTLISMLIASARHFTL